LAGKSALVKDSKSMATFILVSGAWHAGWCWERVTPLLVAAGHRVITPDLAGMGASPVHHGDVTLSLWADQIATLVSKQSDPVILVGHSRGGIVISEAAERVPGSIAKLVYLCAFLVPSGRSLMDVSERPNAMLAQALISEGVSTRLRPDAIGPIFYSETDDAWVGRAVSQLCPEPMEASVTALALTAERFGSVPRAYIECTKDKAISIGLQRAMREMLPCDPVLSLETDHSPFYSAPTVLAHALLKIAAG
jgi:pimeloyl-ACP methyl ester carboxylesterase